MLHDPATALHIRRQVSSFVSQMEMSERNIRNAKSVMDLVRAANTRPTAPAYIASLPDIRLSKQRLEESVRKASEVVIAQEFAKLDTLLNAGDRIRLQAALGMFQRDLRYLAPFAPAAMRNASKHIWEHYRFREEVHQAGEYLIRQLTPVDPRDQITPGHLNPEEICCLTEIIHETVGTIAITKNEQGHCRSVEFHQGRGCYTFADESLPLSQQYHFGTLRDCILMFEDALKVTLPPIKVIWPGHGVWEAHLKYSDSAENPWRLEPGKTYEVTSPKRGTHLYVAVEGGLVYRSEAPHTETYDPKLIWTVDEWRSMRAVDDQADSSAPRPHG